MIELRPIRVRLFSLCADLRLCHFGNVVDFLSVRLCVCVFVWSRERSLIQITIGYEIISLNCKSNERPTLIYATVIPLWYCPGSYPILPVNLFLRPLRFFTMNKECHQNLKL